MSAKINVMFKCTNSTSIVDNANNACQNGLVRLTCFVLITGINSSSSADMPIYIIIHVDLCWTVSVIK